MIEAVRSASIVYLDSAPLVYYIQDNQTFSGLISPIIDAIPRGEKKGVTSYLTLLELLVMPFKKKRGDLVDKYRRVLLKSPHMHLLPLGEDVAEEAARIRASYRFRTPDAVQLASAKLSRADIFITNDRKLRRYKEVRVLVLSEHLGKT